MLMTRESDYAIRIMRALADGNLMTVKQICDGEAIPIQFAYKILKKLSNANIIKIVRGACGGYQLTMDLHDVKLLDLMKAVGEEGIVNACLRPGYQCSWQKQGGQGCEIHRELARIQGKLDEELSRHSIYEILQGSGQ